jgi:hypothetical protein
MLVFSASRPAWSTTSLTRRRVVLAPALTRAEGLAYDQFVATAPSGHYSQTRAWAQVVAAGKAIEPLLFLVRYGCEVVGAGVVLRPVVGGVSLPAAWIAHGPVVAAPADLPEVLLALRQRCLQKGILRLSVMPRWADPERLEVERFLASAGFTACRRGRLARTKRLDLTALDDIKSWSAKYLEKNRQEIGRAVRAGVMVRPGRREDLRTLRRVANLSSDWDEAIGDYFSRPDAALFVSEFRGAPISAVFVTLHNGLATASAFASSGVRPFSPIVLALTEAVQWARRMGALAFEESDDCANPNAGVTYDCTYCRAEILLVGEHVRWF